MGFQINTNVSALSAYRSLSNTQNSLTGSLEKLSSGLRINRAADDAAGLAISEGLRSQIGGYNVAARNAQDGISVVQTAEGALGEVASILQRVRDLGVQAANDSNNAESRAAITTEVTALVDEIDRISKVTNFNGISLLNGTALDGAGAALAGRAPAGLNFQVGADGNDDNKITVDLSTTVSIANLKGNNAAAQGAIEVTAAADFTATNAAQRGVNFANHDNAQKSISNIDLAIEQVSKARSELGAYQNRFETAINSINIAKENLSASESRIRDTDMALEMANFTKANILQQAGTSMLAQANSLPQSILSLLGN